MQEILVKIWDDVHAQDGERVAADAQVELTYVVKRNGKEQSRQVKLDLTDAHAGELDKELARWLDAGHAPDALASHGKPGSAQAREFYAGLRMWAQSVGRDGEHWTSGKNGRPKQLYYPKALVADYEAFLAANAPAA